MRRLLYFLCSLVVLTTLPLHAQETTPLAPPSDADLPLGEVVYQADFLGDTAWTAGSYGDDTFNWQPTRQGLSMVSPIAEGPARYAPGTTYQGLNFYVEMSFIPVVCLSDESAILLNIRSDPRQESPATAAAYVFVVQCDGTYRSRVVELGGESGLIDFNGKFDKGLTPKTVYHLGVFVQGRMVTWYWNGAELGTYFISQRPVGGQIAPGAQLGLDVVVTDLRVWGLSAN